MKNSAAIVSSLALLSACASVATIRGGSDFGAYKPPAKGTLYTYNAVYTDGTPSEQIRQLIIDTGEDFALYANLNEDGVQKEDFFVEYSGLYWAVCDAPQPSMDERKNIKSLWPIREGVSVDVTSGEDGSIHELAVITKVNAGNEQIGQHPAIIVENRYEIVEISRFAPSLSATVRIDWGRMGAADYGGNDELIKIETVDLADYEAYTKMGRGLCSPEPFGG